MPDANLGSCHVRKWHCHVENVLATESGQLTDADPFRSHYDAVLASFGDAPRNDEVVIAFAFATRVRLHARLGGITAEDIEGNDGLR